MKTKITILVLITFLFIAIAATRTIFVADQKRSDTLESREWDSLAGRAQKALTKGKKRVVFPAPIPNYASVASLEESLLYYRVVVAQLVAQKSYTKGSDDIVTWYKFAITETLSIDNDPDASRIQIEAPLPEEIDQEILPIRENEILVAQPGGTLTINGISIVQESEESLSFLPSQQYLLFLSKTSPKNIGNIELGPSGILIIQPDGQLKAVNGKVTPIAQDTDRLYGRSIDHMRTDFARRRSQK